MKGPGALAAASLVLLPAACAAAHTTTRARDARAAPAAGLATSTQSTARSAGGRARPRARPQALVTAETENRLLAISLPGGRVVRRVNLPAGPEDVAATRTGGFVIVVSSRPGRVSVLDRPSLRVIRTFGGFDEPHIAAVSPDGRRAYITDDTRGTLTVIRLSDMTVTSTIHVGAGAHHLTFSPNRRRAWVALGESAGQISILDTRKADRPRVIGHFSAGYPAHDLSFSPNGRQVWITSAAGTEVTAFDAGDHRVLFRIPVGAPPQHLTFAGRYAYLTSGYGATIEKVSAASGRLIVRRRAPYGSFELDAADGYVVTSSLLRGTLAIYTPDLALLRIVMLAPVTREVAISRP